LHSVKNKAKKTRGLIRAGRNALYNIHYQSWALALFFQVRSPLCVLFFTKDRYRSSAHFADFQVRSSLYRSKKKRQFALGKER